jgi:hypothetical protein
MTQSSMKPDVSKPVAHISLDFSVQDKAKLTDVLMAGIAVEYLKRMGYRNTQFIIVRHHDTDHPHIHIVVNRIDNDGNRISDQNERFRSTKICMELTKQFGLYIASGKENVKEHRLKEPDKTKYEIYHAIQKTIPKCRNWYELTAELRKSGITTEFQHNGSTDKIQGVRFAKNGFPFNGSKIDRSCSFSKIDYLLKQNNLSQGRSLAPSLQNHSQGQSLVEAAGSVVGGLLDVPPANLDDDAEQAEYLRRQKLKKKRRGIRF